MTKLCKQQIAVTCYLGAAMEGIVISITPVEGEDYDTVAVLYGGYPTFVVSALHGKYLVGGTIRLKYAGNSIADGFAPADPEDN